MFSKLLSRTHLRFFLMLAMVLLPLWLASHHSAWATITISGTDDSNQANLLGSNSISPIVTESGLISVSIDGSVQSQKVGESLKFLN